MSEVLFLVRAIVNELDLAHMDSYYENLRQKLSAHPGFIGLSLWRMTGSYDELLVVQEYRDHAASEAGMEAMANSRLLAETHTADYNPAELLDMEVAGRYGVRISQTPVPSYLSMSVRVADPGYEEELIEKLSDIFAELSLIPGFLGAVYGCREALREEAVGVAIWESAEAFSRSLPPKQIKYQVKLYEKIY